MSIAYLGLGSNLGDRAASLAAAIEALDWGAVSVTERSRVYETVPVGGPAGQPDFLNQVVAVETALDPVALLDRCLEVERALGRAREHEERWGPRSIDVDLLLYDDAVIDEPACTVPHPLMHERAFVLVPLAEIAPGLTIPGRGRVDELCSRLDRAGVAPA